MHLWTHCLYLRSAQRVLNIQWFVECATCLVKFTVSLCELHGRYSWNAEDRETQSYFCEICSMLLWITGESFQKVHGWNEQCELAARSVHVRNTKCVFFGWTTCSYEIHMHNVVFEMRSVYLRNTQGVCLRCIACICEIHNVYLWTKQCVNMYLWNSCRALFCIDLAIFPGVS